MTDRSVLGQLTSFLPGFRPVEGGQLKEMANFLFSTQTGIVASTTSTQAAATPLGAAINIIQTSTGSGTDAVRLTPAIIGAEQWVENRTSNTIKVFANGTDRIIPSNSPTPNASSVGVSVASGELAGFQCGTAGVYKQGNLPGGVAAAPGILVESGSAVKISGMGAAGTLTGTELVDVVQSGANRKTTTQDIADLSGGVSSGLMLLEDSGAANTAFSGFSAGGTPDSADFVVGISAGANIKWSVGDLFSYAFLVAAVVVGDNNGNDAMVAASDGGATSRGGHIEVNAGAGGTLAGSGGYVKIQAGTSRGSGSAGNITLQAGVQIGTGRGGHLWLLGGDNFGSGDGGNINLTPGNGAGGVAGRVVLTNSNPPVAADSAGIAGSIAIDDEFIYICVEDNTWKRAAISTWP